MQDLKLRIFCTCLLLVVAAGRKSSKTPCHSCKAGHWRFLAEESFLRGSSSCNHVSRTDFMLMSLAYTPLLWLSTDKTGWSKDKRKLEAGWRASKTLWLCRSYPSLMKQNSNYFWLWSTREQNVIYCKSW